MNVSVRHFITRGRTLRRSVGNDHHRTIGVALPLFAEEHGA